MRTRTQVQVEAEPAIKGTCILLTWDRNGLSPSVARLTMEKARDAVFLISASLMYNLNMCGLMTLIGHETTRATKVTHWSIVGGISGVVERV